MEIKTTGSKVTIKGNIKSISDYQNIKSALDTMKSSTKHITVVLEESISIISSVIGYLNKLVLKDNVDLEIIVHDDNLYDLFDDLGLIQLFKVKRV